MNVRIFALVLGIVFLLVGVMGFIPGLVTHPMDAHDHGLNVTGPGHGYLLGLFHVNVLHNIVHLLFGVWGIAAYRKFSASRTYSRTVAVAYALLAVMGLFPVLNTVFGLIPIHGNDVWLHLLIAAVAAYFGFAAAPVEEPLGTSRASHATIGDDVRM